MVVEGVPLMGRGLRRRPRLLAAKLREIRNGLRLSQGALIERLGQTEYMNQAEISDFENGVREPDLLTLKAYADAAGVSIDCLIDDDAELPDKLPGAKYARASSGKTQKGQAKVTTVVTLRVIIESDKGDAAAEKRARTSVEKACLKQYGMKKLNDDEYELTFSHRDEAELDRTIYTLLGTIKIEARKRKRSVKLRVREKDGDGYW
jgi:transcriptional regulator with XRE-family HTH domain